MVFTIIAGVVVVEVAALCINKAVWDAHYKKFPHKQEENDAEQAAYIAKIRESRLANSANRNRRSTGRKTARPPF